MIPILYDSYELAFTSNGLGRLADCVSCTVTEERNGIYECEFQYPVTGEMYSQIKEGRIIGVTHDDAKDIQPFDIYARSAPLDGVVTFYAHHISYRLSNVILKPFTATTCAQTMAKLQSSTYNSNIFTFWTDKSVTANFEQKVPDSVRAVLAGKEGSVLDVYGTGEYEFDKLAVKLHLNRGNDNGVSIRYGVNLTDLTHDYDQSGTYSAVAPYWVNKDDGSVVSLPGGYVISSEVTAIQEPWTTGDGEIMTTGDGDPIYFNAPKIIPVPMDLSDAFEEEPTVAQLQTEALRRLNNSEAWLPDENIKVSFVNLADTEEYASMSALQRVKLCDKVSVYCGPLGVSAAKMQVIRVVYNVLDNRYDEIELGKAKLSFAETILAKVDDNINKATEDLVSHSKLQEAVDNATNMITGATNSHVKFVYDANGGLQEILVMDTEDINTAVNIWRWNSGGLGFSSNGYAGPYSTAMTADGAIVADMITTGVLNADLIQAGVLDGELVQAKLLQIIDAVGNVIASFNDTITMGRSGQSRALIDFNSFELVDKSNNQYFYVGDLRNSSGYVETTETFTGDGTKTVFYLSFNYKSENTTSVTINGVESTSWSISYYFSRSIITFNSAPSDGAEIVVSYGATNALYALTFGNRSGAVGLYSAAIGQNVTADGQYSCAIGRETIASGEYSHSEGSSTKALGAGSHAEGYSTKASGGDSHAEGIRTEASGSSSHAEGHETVAGGNYSHTEGDNTEASGSDCHAEGHYSNASGHYSHAEGYYTTASGQASHAEGRYSTASGVGGHAEGDGCQALGDYSHAEGYNTKAYGDYYGDHAEGKDTEAKGGYYGPAHAEGGNTKATGSCAHAEGYDTLASSDYQHVFGRYNVEDTAGTYIEIVGNRKAGTSGGRKNARTLDWSGNEWIAGTLTQASDSRLKEESGEIPDVSTIRARRFKWNDQKGTHDDDDHIGYFAQDVEQVAPYLVHEDAMGYKSLDYIGFLCAKVESLERRIAELEKGRE